MLLLQIYNGSKLMLVSLLCLHDLAEADNKIKNYLFRYCVAFMQL